MKPKSNFTLLHDLVMIFPISPKMETESGIILHKSVEKNSTAPVQGMVIACGPGINDKKGNLIPMPVEVGDRVIFVKNAAKEIKYAGDTFLVVPTSEILCKVQNGSTV